MQRHGLSEIVSWVLLIGVSMLLGVVVSQWLHEQAQHSTDTLIEDTTTDLVCEDVAFNAFFESGTSCGSLTITNKGYHTLDEIRVRSDFGVDSFPLNLTPGATLTKPLNTLSLGVEIIPVVLLAEKPVGCTDKKIKLAC